MTWLPSTGRQTKPSHVFGDDAGGDELVVGDLQLSLVPWSMSVGFADRIMRPASRATKIMESRISCKSRSAAIFAKVDFYCAAGRSGSGCLGWIPTLVCLVRYKS